MSPRGGNSSEARLLADSRLVHLRRYQFFAIPSLPTYTKGHRFEVFDFSRSQAHLTTMEDLPPVQEIVQDVTRPLTPIPPDNPSSSSVRKVGRDGPALQSKPLPILRESIGIPLTPLLTPISEMTCAPRSSDESQEGNTYREVPCPTPPATPTSVQRDPKTTHPWSRSAYQRLLQYQHVLDSEHERRFRRGMAHVTREMLQFEMENT